MTTPLPDRPSAGPLLQVGLALLVGGNLVLFSYLALHTGLSGGRDAARHSRIRPATSEEAAPNPALVLPEPEGDSSGPASTQPTKTTEPTLVAAAPQRTPDGVVDEPKPQSDTKLVLQGNNRDKPEGPSARREKFQPGRLPRDDDDDDKVTDDDDDKDKPDTAHPKDTASGSIHAKDTHTGSVKKVTTHSRSVKKDTHSASVKSVKRTGTGKRTG